MSDEEQRDDDPDRGPSPPEPTPVERERRRMFVDGIAFGKRLRERRQFRGWSVHDLHDVTGIAASTISNLERGKTTNPEPWVTHALAVAMGCPSAGDMLAWLDARDRGEAYEPAGGRGVPFGPARVPGTVPATAGVAGVPGVGDVRLDVLVEQLLRGYWRAQAGGAGRGQVAQLTTLGVGLWLLSPRTGRRARRGRRGRARGGAALSLSERTPT